MTNFFEYDYKVGHNHHVDVTCLNHPKSFFVRSVELNDLVKFIERPGPGLVPAHTMRLGLRVIYRSPYLEKFVRGEVINMNYILEKRKTTYDMRAIDYGFFDKFVRRRNIHPLDSSTEPHNKCPALATHCQLHLCEPIGETFSQDVFDTMRHFVGFHTATINVKSKTREKLVVELRTIESPKDIATTLALLEYTTLTKGQDTVNRFTNTTAALSLTQTLKYKHRQLNVGDTLHVRVQSGTSVSGFYVADVNDFKMLRSAEPSFSMYCRSRHMKDEDLVPGRPCAVKLDNLDQYERAILKKVNPNSKAVLELVDWGKEIESNFSSIRSIDKEFYLTQPIIAIYCSTTEDQVWTSTLPAFFFKGYEFGVKIMESGNNSDKPHKVNIYPVHMLKQ